MNTILAASVAVLAMSSAAEATFVIGTAATVGTATTLSSASVASLGLLGGAVILKGLVLGAALLASRRRGRRDVDSEESDAAFAVLTASEPGQCYRRLVCDLAAGAIPDNDKILSLFNQEVSPLSPKFEYATAAKVGKMVKNANLCEVRYSCPLSTVEIQKLFA